MHSDDNSVIFPDTPSMLREQADYYRARAPEYDQWWYRQGRFDRGHTDQWVAEAEEVAAALGDLQPSGCIMELACGTGIWSERLLPFAAEYIAVDASAEMLALNAARLRAPRVRYIQADLFQWEPPQRADFLFFSFWLSHVPPDHFTAFWEFVQRCLVPGGRVFFLDSRREERSTASDHVLPDRSSALLRRRLNDGREFQIFKVFYDRLELAERLSHLGWSFDIRETNRFFIYGSGHASANAT